MLGREGFTYKAAWPVFNPDLVVEDTVTIAIQVNGKLRDTMEAAAGSSDEDLQKVVLARPKVQANVDGKTIRKVIVIPDKLVNIVAN